MMENLPTKHGMWIVIVITYSPNYIVFTGIAYLCGEWRLLSRVVAAFTILPLIMLLFIYDNPRWLANKGRIDEAGKAMVGMKKNRAKVDPFEEGEMIDYEQKKSEEKGDKRAEGRGRKDVDEKDREKAKTESQKKAKKVDKVLSPDNTLREVEGGMPQMEVTHNTSHEPIFTDEQLM